MNELLAFVLGLLATWIGIGFKTWWEKSERRKLTFARIYGALEAEHRLMLENSDLREFYTLYLYFQQRRKEAASKPNGFQEFVKVQDELRGLAQEMFKSGALKGPLAKMKDELATQSESEKQALRETAGRVRDEIRRNLPPDEDVAVLPYNLIPYFYEYRNRAERLVYLAESISHSNPTKFDETHLAKWFQQFVETILGFFLMSDILRNHARVALKIPTTEPPPQSEHSAKAN